MRCRVQSADRAFFDGEATMVVARSERGEFAVMAGHAPLLSTMKSGPLRVKTADGERVFACFGGTLRVSATADVDVLAEDAVPLEEIDLSAPAQSEERLIVLRGVLEQHG
jgi:F-type H+-transporting ATPase subunit epsilon